MVPFPASFGSYRARLRCGKGEERPGRKHFLEVYGNMVRSQHPLRWVSPRLALGLMGPFQNDTNEPVVVRGFTACEI